MEVLIKATQLLLSLSILVILHEMGHFLPARWFKIRVEKFYLFFDPWFSLWKKKVPPCGRCAAAIPSTAWAGYPWEGM